MVLTRGPGADVQMTFGVFCTMLVLSAMCPAVLLWVLGWQVYRLLGSSRWSSSCFPRAPSWLQGTSLGYDKLDFLTVRRHARKARALAYNPRVQVTVEGLFRPCSCTHAHATDRPWHDVTRLGICGRRLPRLWGHAFTRSGPRPSTALLLCQIAMKSYGSRAFGRYQSMSAHFLCKKAKGHQVGSSADAAIKVRAQLRPRKPKHTEATSYG